MKPGRSIPLLLLGGSLLASAADELSLSNGDLLTGTARSVDADGRLTFETPNAFEPLVIRSDALGALRFGFEQPEDLPQSERVKLTNGDVLPGEILNLGEESLEIRTWACGDLVIPRSAIASVHFGVAPHDLVFTGPGKEAGWQDNENWSFQGAGASSSSRGTVARPDVLPQQFILRFRLEWETNPNFRFYFCDDLLDRSGEEDRYYFEVNTAGLQLKRQAADSKRRWYPLWSSDRRPASFPKQAVEVELRVDRERRLIYIYIDGESEGRQHDPIGEIPTGTGILLESLAGGDMRNIVSGIEIYEWDAISQIHRTEGHKNPAADAIVTVESERYEGSVRGLEGGGDDRALLIKSPHSDDPVRIPIDALSVLYFRKAPDGDPAPARFRVKLAALGSLSLNKPELSPERLTLSHPLLGDVSVRREALVSLESLEGGSATSSQPQ